MFHKIDFADVNNITKWAAIIMSFRTLLRKSNLVQSTYKESQAVVKRSDICYNESGIILKVRRTKTLQNKEYVLEIPVCQLDSEVFCVVSMLHTHLARTRHIQDGPLYWVIDKKNQWKPLLYRDLLSFLKRSVQSIGLNPDEVGLHSLRRSGAAYMHTLGISLIDIMNAGDWKSLAALAYLISPLSRKNQIEASVAESLSRF